ncbi:MAG TPA: mechanosensitive ion channel [Anaerolineales bacterium]|nr:mechanosensitive ion channel [Anaerolineales bacterium]
MLPTDSSLSSLWADILTFLPRLAVSLVILIIAWLLAVWATKGLQQALQRRKVDRELTVLLRLIARVGILALGVILAVEQLAPGRFSSLIAGLGVVGLTIGFALQDVTKNLIAGILLLLQQPLQIGDTVEVADFAGVVTDISLRTTELRTHDGRYVLIPNANVFLSSVVNYTRSIERRIEISLGVAYDADLDKVARVALEGIRKIPGILEKPAPQVVFSAFGWTTIQFTAYYWIDTRQTSATEAQDIGVRLLKSAFEEAAIGTPFTSASG